MRQIVLDTETTGLEVRQGHRVIEIGCVEIVNRKLTGNHYHQYINPERESDQGALEVHGITQEFLSDKPVFTDIAETFISFIEGAELIIHNAPFDLGFINNELELLGKNYPRIEDICTVVDTVMMARKKHPGQKNSLDALCKRYVVDNSQRDLHGALLDSEILADVYLLMTGGQTALSLGGADDQDSRPTNDLRIERLNPDRPKLNVLMANHEELAAHDERLEFIFQQSGQRFWSGPAVNSQTENIPK
jgi:DNA polymerase-3 subunit epsilon